MVYVGKDKFPQEQELHLSDAFYKKDSSKLELVVKVKNCSDSQNLPISKTCDILKEYCQFIEIVEHTYNKNFPKSSLRKAIQKAVSQNILTDYLDRKSREVINMLCAKYDYKMDIAVKQEEAFERGVQKKAVEDATKALMLKIMPEQVSQITGLSLEQVLKLQKELSAN